LFILLPESTKEKWKKKQREEADISMQFWSADFLSLGKSAYENG